MVHRIIRVENSIYDKEYKLIININKIDILSCFFYSISLVKIPILLNNLNNIEYTVKGHRIGFYKGPIFEERFDEPNFELKENEIQIRCGEEDNSLQICNLNYFYITMLQYAHTALEAVTWFDLLEKGIVDKQCIIHAN